MLLGGMVFALGAAADNEEEPRNKKKDPAPKSVSGFIPSALFSRLAELQDRKRTKKPGRFSSGISLHSFLLLARGVAV
jgi:hypothetical protein